HLSAYWFGIKPFLGLGIVMRMLWFDIIDQGLGLVHNLPVWHRWMGGIQGSLHLGSEPGIMRCSGSQPSQHFGIVLRYAIQEKPVSGLGADP
ncbi:hypothetical protein M1C61_15435, partial [Chromohalobacter israelensis]